MERVQRLRGRAGQRQRARRLARTNGLCEHCLAKGKRVRADRVNHIVPLDHGGTDFDANTENLCRPCDIKATARQFGFDKAEGGTGVNRAGRPIGAGHAWNLVAPPIPDQP